MHAVTYPIRDTRLVSRMPCRNILSLVRACTIGWGGQRNGSLANDLPATRDRDNDLHATRDRDIMGLMSLSSTLLVPGLWTVHDSSLLCGLLDLCGLCGLIDGAIVPWTMSEEHSLLNLS